MKKKNVKKIYEAVGLQLAFLLIVGTMIQSSVGVEINSEDEIFDNNKFQPPPKTKGNEFRVWGKGQLYYIFPKDLNNFEGEYIEDGASKAVNGYIKNTNIEVYNRIPRFGPGPYRANLFAFKTQPFRFYFRLILPKEFEIVNYTGYICCDFISIPHGPAWTEYFLSGEAERIIRK